MGITATKQGLAEMKTNENEVNFVDNYPIDTYDQPPSSEPGKDLKESYPFGTISFKVGIPLKF